MMVRNAVSIDIPEILNLAKSYIDNEVVPGNYHYAGWSPELMAYHLGRSVASYDDIVLVAVQDGCVIGYLWAGVHSLGPWTNCQVSSDYLFYVMPEHRGSLAAYRLIRAYREWALELGCAEIRLSVASGINHERTGKLYEAMGFTPFAGTYNLKVWEK